MSLLKLSDIVNSAVSYTLYATKFVNLGQHSAQKEAMKAFIISAGSRKMIELYPNIYGSFAVLPAEYMMAGLMSAVYDIVATNQYGLEKLGKEAMVQVAIQVAGDYILKLAGKPDVQLL